MIKSVTIKDPEYTPVEWWPKVFPAPCTWEFTPGMNVLWGRNGSGKTTLIKLLARMFHCEQGGISMVTNTSLGALAGGRRFDRENREKVEVAVEHDGTSVVYYDPSNVIGLEGGMAAFDYDFMDAGIMNAMGRLSAGQMALARLGDVMKRYTPTIQRKAAPPEYVEKLLKATIDKGPMTILMDEPDANLDWPTKLDLWHRFDMIALEQQKQFIIASHSICALRLVSCNYIEIPTEGYLDETYNSLHDTGFLTDKNLTLAEVLARRRKDVGEKEKDSDNG